jgi:hypothetical protein
MAVRKDSEWPQLLSCLGRPPRIRRRGWARIKAVQSLPQSHRATSPLTTPQHPRTRWYQNGPMPPSLARMNCLKKSNLFPDRDLGQWLGSNPPSQWLACQFTRALWAKRPSMALSRLRSHRH